MEKVKLVVLVWSMAYALVTLLLFSNLAWAIEPQSQVHESGADELPSQVEADSGTYHDEPSARSRSQHRSNKGRSPIFPGGPGLAMAPTVSGWVFCASCMNVNLPLLGPRSCSLQALRLLFQSLAFVLNFYSCLMIHMYSR